KDHHGSLQDVDQVERDVTEELNHRAAAAQRTEEERREHDADGMTPAQQGHGDPGKSVAGREMVDEAVIDTEDLKAAGHAAEEARDGEGDEDRAGEVDANRPCEPRVEARHAELVADPRATEKVGIQ